LRIPEITGEFSARQYREGRGFGKVILDRRLKETNKILRDSAGEKSQNPKGKRGFKTAEISWFHLASRESLGMSEAGAISIAQSKAILIVFGVQAF
jgi:hypothetical protein